MPLEPGDFLVSLYLSLRQLLATSRALRWFSLEEERVMQQSCVSISVSFEKQGINPVGENAQVT